MEVINIQLVWRRWWQNLAHAVLDFDPFSELATKSRTEALILENGFELFRGSRVDFPLTKTKRVATSSDLTALCAAVHKGEDVVLSVHSDLCFSHELDVQAMALGKIDQILALELARVTPFTPNQVYSGWIKIRSGLTRGNIRIKQFVIRRDYLKPILVGLRESGATPVAILVRQNDQTAIQFALALDGKGYGVQKISRWMRVALISFVAFLCSAGLLAATIAGHLSTNLDLITSATVASEKDAIFVRKQLEQLKATHGEMKALLAKKTSAPSRIAVIEEVSRLLPDDAFVEGLSISADQVVADGAAAKPEGLVATLESSTMFKDVTFNAPIFQNPGETKSRFSLKFTLEKTEEEN
jgi:general secretion pathway protein L